MANSLNDIGKDHSDLAVEICRRWSTGASPGRASIVRHALRSLVKQGHRGALETLGAGGRPEVGVTAVRLDPPTVEIGGALRFRLEIASTGTGAQQLVVDYAVHFVKADGTTRPKVFKLRRITLPPSARMWLGGTVSFADMTTRRHYPGRHRIDLLINGMAHPLSEFEVAPGGRR